MASVWIAARALATMEHNALLDLWYLKEFHVRFHRIKE